MIHSITVIKLLYVLYSCSIVYGMLQIKPVAHFLSVYEDHDERRHDNLK